MKFTISILAMNGLAMTKRCLESVAASGGDYELILTDNASNDGTQQYFESLRSDRVRVIRNEVNRGFTQPSREVVKMARGKYFVMLNNDAEVPKGWLEVMEKTLESNPRSALCGPQGGCTSFDTNFCGVPSQRVDYVDSCIMIKTELALKHGLFSDYLYFAYCEDADLSLRMRELGYTIHVAPFKIIHKPATTSKTIPLIKTIHDRNHFHFRQRWRHFGRTMKIDHPIIIKRAGAIGDVLLTTPIIRALKEQRPSHPIHFWTNSPDVLRGNPHLASVGSERPRIEGTQVINLDMAYENLPKTHIVKAFARAAGIEDYVNKIDFYPSQEDEEWADSISTLKGSIGIHPGPTTWKGKNWEVKRWIELQKVLKKDGHITTLFGPDGIPTTIGQMAAAFKRCKLVVCLDSSPLHFAQAMGTKAVALFGATSPEYILTEGSEAIGIKGDAPCAGARHLFPGVAQDSCNGECMRSITVDQVLEAVRELL